MKSLEADTVQATPSNTQFARPSRTNKGPTPMVDGDAPLLSKAEISKDNIQIGARGLPDIMPGELTWLKKRIEASIDTRVSTIIDPLTYNMGPVGEISHDSRTLMQPRKPQPTCEIRFTV